MLQKLVIRNYAIIDNLTIEPDNGLNIVTGETGAGKSIILGALSLILGERADTSVLINKNEKSVIEGFFNVADNKAFRHIIEEADIDYDDQCIIRREIAVSGKSRAFVNDTPVNLQLLNKLTSLLVDLQQQFGHLALEEDSFHINTLNAVADAVAVYEKYQKTYSTYRSIQKQLTEKQALQTKYRQEAEYKKFLLDELTALDLKDNEIEDTETQLKQISNAERIINVLQGGIYALSEGEAPILNELKKTVQNLQGIADVMPGVSTLHDRIQSAWLELKDIADELESEQGKVSIDPALMEQLQQKLDEGYKLFKKHGVNSTGELKELQAKLEDELQTTTNLDQEIESLQAEVESINKTLVTEANKLSALRIDALPGFIKQINHLLGLVGMPNARFDVTITKTTPGLHGQDNIQFLLDANKSGQFQLLHKAASGGEMSRIMLCIKSVVAQALHLPTLIFDEVDAGISGEAAKQVGLLLKQLAAYHQLICITHQPQVAARGNMHFYVYKEADKSGKLATKVKTMSKDERVIAIAQMIGGEKPSDTAIENAKELVYS